MPFNGSNTFTIVNTFVPGTTILSSAVNANFTDIATGLSDCVTRDAQGAVTGNLVFSSTGFIMLPSGTTVQRPSSAQQAFFRFNSTTVTPEFFDGTAWNSIAATVIQPQGYLTLTNLAGGGPIITSDVTSATAVYYSPYVGQLCPIYNGSSFVNQIFSEQTLTLVSQHVANTIYDVFAFLNGTTFTIATGPAWSNSAAGSGARGTGAGTTQLQRINGIWVNQVSLTARNGGSTFTIPANQGTYLGSLYIDSVAGQITCYRSLGQSRKWGVWNAYNRVPVILNAADTTAATWTYATNTIRPSNGNTANSLTTFTGLAEEEINIIFSQTAQPISGTALINNGIGYNSTTAYATSSKKGSFNATGGVISELLSLYVAVPSLGINTVTCLENSPSSVSVTFFGAGSSNNNMLMTAQWRA